MYDYIFIGPTPSNEECAQLGEENYETRARAECQRFIELIREKLGKEPDGARLIVKGEYHDMGVYYEVAVKFDDSKPEAIEYAFKVDSESPQEWSKQ